MAERRMFAKTIIDSDAFLDMPLSSQALYFHLSMRADDDGFVNNAKKIMRMVGANNNDFDLLLGKRFIIQFEDGICVIKHWRIHNYIQKDRYKPTVYQDHVKKIDVKNNKSYTLNLPKATTKISDTEDAKTDYGHNVSKVDTQVRLGKVSIGKYSILLEDEEEYIISETEIETYKKTYTKIDVEEEILKMQSWCLANPTKRKTKRGASRFVNGWLNRATNSIKENEIKATAPKKTAPVPEWYEGYTKDLEEKRKANENIEPMSKEEWDKLVNEIDEVM